MKKTCLMIALLLVLCSVLPALAESVVFDGTVVSLKTESVTADISGTVAEVYYSAGEYVTKGTVLAKLSTTGVYAQRDGTVYVFGEEGDSVSYLTERYGAVAYLKPTIQYTISASTRNAYDLEENKVIIPGEKVYLKCYSDGTHTGIGMVTAVSGSSFTVEVTEGEFEDSETVSIFRGSTYDSTTRIGRGTLSLVDPVTYSGSETASVVKYLVASGDSVTRGQLLFETMEGDFDGMNATDCITATADGVIESISLSVGESVTAGASVATIAPKESMCVQATVPECDLAQVEIGDEVTLSFEYSEGLQMKGNVQTISYLALEDSEETSYYAYISFEPDENIRYGMNVEISAED